jgi:hypothetical protein
MIRAITPMATPQIEITVKMERRVRWLFDLKNLKLKYHSYDISTVHSAREGKGLPHG